LASSLLAPRCSGGIMPAPPFIISNIDAIADAGSATIIICYQDFIFIKTYNSAFAYYHHCPYHPVHLCPACVFANVAQDVLVGRIVDYTTCIRVDGRRRCGWPYAILGFSLMRRLRIVIRIQ
jgi:hypothetical protein